MKDLGSQNIAKERVEKDKSMFGGREIKGKTLAVIGLGKCRNQSIILFLEEIVCCTHQFVNESYATLGHIGAATARIGRAHV